jgi:hypothetical protein
MQLLMMIPRAYDCGLQTTSWKRHASRVSVTLIGIEFEVKAAWLCDWIKVWGAFPLMTELRLYVRKRLATVRNIQIYWFVSLSFKFPSRASKSMSQSNIRSLWIETILILVAIFMIEISSVEEHRILQNALLAILWNRNYYSLTEYGINSLRQTLPASHAIEDKRVLRVEKT